MRVTRRQLLRTAFGVAASASVVVAFTQTWERSALSAVPPAAHLATAGVLAVVGLAVALVEWAVLVARPAAGLARGFYLSQLGKYVPGAVWQAAGQVGYAVSGGVPLGHASVALGVFTLTQATAGAVLGAVTALLASHLDWRLRLACAVAAFAAVLLDRRWMVRAATWFVTRRNRGAVAPASLVPPQQAIVTAWGLGIANLVLVGAGYWVLLGAPPRHLPLVVVAHTLAWTVGFLVFPIPSGLGVREAVLVALLADVASAGAVLAASIALRLVLIAAEAVLAGLAHVLPVRSLRPAPPSPSAER